jgi:hypothetical protein
VKNLRALSLCSTLSILPLAPFAAMAQEATAPEAAPAAPSSIVGTWISPQVTQAGILMILQFAPEDAVRASIRSRMGVTYEVLSSEGTTHRLSFSTGDSTAEQTVKVEGDQLTLGQPGNKEVRELRRLPGGPTSDLPFVGRWSTGEPGATDQMLLEYTEDGNLLFDAPVRTIYGKYTLEGDQIEIDWDEGTRARQDIVYLRWEGAALWGADAQGDEHLAFRWVGPPIPASEVEATGSDDESPGPE